MEMETDCPSDHQRFGLSNAMRLLADRNSHRHQVSVSQFFMHLRWMKVLAPGRLEKRLACAGSSI
jgi:hypothetical protein